MRIAHAYVRRSASRRNAYPRPAAQAIRFLPCLKAGVSSEVPDDRTAEDDALLIHQVHASAYHWMQVGTPAHNARSHWMCSRVYCVLGRAEPAFYHARLVEEICRTDGIGDWDLAFAYEALARAHTIAGNPEQARGWLERARLACADVADDEDRELVVRDLESIPADGSNTAMPPKRF